MAQGILSFKYEAEKKTHAGIIFLKISDGWKMARLEIGGLVKSQILWVVNFGLSSTLLNRSIFDIYNIVL